MRTPYEIERDIRALTTLSLTLRQKADHLENIAHRLQAYLTSLENKLEEEGE